MKTKMNTKNLLVSFCTVAIFLFLAMSVSATTDIATIDSIEVNDLTGDNISVIAGEILTVKVFFTAIEDASDVKLEVEVEGAKVNVDETIGPFDIEDGRRYVKTVQLVLPYELKDQVSENIALNVKLWNGDFRTEVSDIMLRIQRPSYNADVMSIEVSQNVRAGELLPVDVVLKNIGYNELDDTYVTLRIVELGLERTAYFGDIVAIEDDDSVRGRFYMRIPYEAVEGIYTIEAEASNDDMSVSEVEQIIINNDFSSGNIIVSNYRQIVAAGQNAEYSMLLVNPTNQLKVYRIVTEPACEVNCNLYTSTNSPVVSVPAGLSKTVTITANAVEEGEYTFNVNVLSGENLEGVVTYNLGVEGRSSNSPVAVLTVILAIIFLVLLVVLIVLLGKKPQKAEEFGESYY